MKDYTTLTHEVVDLRNGDARCLDAKYPVERLRDRRLDLVLNGATINSIKKEEIRAMLRQTYAALKCYEVIGPMASPFMNDPNAVVALAFLQLYPKLSYSAQYVPEIETEDGKPAYGETIFPDDGSAPIISISAKAPIGSGPELLAHELAHVAAGKDAGHGPEWEKANDAIFQKYNDIFMALIPDEHEKEGKP